MFKINVSGDCKVCTPLHQSFTDESKNDHPDMYNNSLLPDTIAVDKFIFKIDGTEFVLNIDWNSNKNFIETDNTSGFFHQIDFCVQGDITKTNNVFIMGTLYIDSTENFIGLKNFSVAYDKDELGELNLEYVQVSYNVEPAIQP